jgi:hypothetical protein
MIPRSRQEPWEKAAEEEVKKVVMDQPGKLDFSDVVILAQQCGKIHEEEARAALVHMINDNKLVENPNGTIRFPRNV